MKIPLFPEKPSHLVSLLAWSMALLVIINLGFVMFQKQRMANDARIINMAGFIRGNAQRYVKLELNNIRADSLKQEIDAIFGMFLDGNRDYVMWGNQQWLLERFESLSDEWDDLTGCVAVYGADPSPAHREKVVLRSELFWHAANSLVSAAEEVAESKVSLFSFMAVIVVGNLCVIGLVFFINRRFIKDQLERLANHDSLTNLLNRYAYSVTIEREMERSRRYGNHLSLIMFDIDHFKQVNDRWGHSTGDNVLRKLAGHVGSILRSTDYFFRVGGEEFAVLAPETSLAQATRLGEKLRTSVERLTVPEVGTITISAGVARYDGCENPDILYARADEMLYRAKKDGRNRVETAGDGAG